MPCRVQGTFLPESKAADLEEMHQHDDMIRCAADIIRAYRDLKAEQRDLLLAADEEERAKLRRHITHASSGDMEASVSHMLEAQVRVSMRQWGQELVSILSPADQQNDCRCTLCLRGKSVDLRVRLSVC